MGTFPNVPPYLLLFLNKDEIELHLEERPRIAYCLKI